MTFQQDDENGIYTLELSNGFRIVVYSPLDEDEVVRMIVSDEKGAAGVLGVSTPT